MNSCTVHIHELLTCIWFVSGATALRAAAQFGPGTGRIWLSNVACTLADPALANCTFGNEIGVNNCNHGQDAGVICFTGSGRWYNIMYHGL